MTMKFNIATLRTDVDKETKGVWVAAGAGLRLLIARLGNPEYRNYLQSLLKPLQAELQGVGDVDRSRSEDLTRKAMARHILLGWENLQDYKKGPDGKTMYNGDNEPVLEDVPYSLEKAEELMKIPDFADLVSRYATSQELFRVAYDQRTKGN